MGARKVAEEVEIVEIEKATRQSSLRDLCQALFRHKWKIITFFLVAVVGVSAATFYSPSVYCSEAKLLVQLGRESVALDPTATMGQTIHVYESKQNQINSELEILTSREIADEVVGVMWPQLFVGLPRHSSQTDNEAAMNTQPKRWSLRAALKEARRRVNAELPKNPEAAVVQLMNNLDVEVLNDSSVMKISYEDYDPKLAQRVLKTIIDLYLEKHIAAHKTPGSYEFFAQQSENLQGKLASIEQELLQYKDSTGVSSPGEQREILLGRIADLEREIGTTEVEITVSRARLQTLKETLSNIPDAIAKGEGLSDYAADLMRARLYELQMKEQDLVTKFRDDSKQVQMIRQEAAEAQKLLNEQNIQQVESAFLDEQATLSSLTAKLEDLKAQLADAKESQKALNAADIRITQLLREIDIQTASYRKYSDSFEQARIDHALENGKISNISVVQAATLPLKPVRPRKGLNLALGVIFGMLGGIGLGLFCDYVDHSIKTPEESEEKLGLPTLCRIPYIPTYSLLRKQRIDQSNEAVEALQEHILLGSNGTKRLRVVAVTGSDRNEGVSTVAANLAITLSRLGQGDVLLIDANFTHPSIHEILDTKLSPGLADALANGKTDLSPKVTDNLANSRRSYGAVLSVVARNLHALSAGKASENLSEILDSDRFRKLLNAVKKDHRFVVVDLPAISQAPWATRLASLCDGVALVVEAERLRWEVVQRVKEELLRSDAKILGVILNKRRFHVPQWLYRML
jgi:capsular exopolysaccharide synthesis family protein